MPFIIGPAPIRHTLRYLQKGTVVLKDRVKILTVHFNHKGEHHRGAREFVFWHLGQLQYKNPNVQIALFREMTPAPFIRCWLAAGAIFEQLRCCHLLVFFVGNEAKTDFQTDDDTSDVVMDIDSKSKEEILEHLNKILGKPPDLLAEEEMQKEKKDNPANFGKGCEKHCICEVPGQVPCPAILPLPKHMRGKYKFQKAEQ